jgi:hypothetical protein
MTLMQKANHGNAAQSVDLLHSAADDGHFINPPP